MILMSNLEGGEVREKIVAAVPDALDPYAKGVMAKVELVETGISSEPQTLLRNAAGEVDLVLKRVGWLFGMDGVDKRFTDFGRAVGEMGSDELKTKYGELESDPDRASRLSMGTKTGEAVVKKLIESSGKSSDGLLKGVSKEVSEAVTAVGQRIETDTKLVEDLSIKVKEDKAEMMALLEGMWKQQEQLDEVRAALIEARSADENDEEGWKLKRSGGVVRRTIATVAGIIPGVSERLSAVVKGPRETRREKVDTTLAAVEGYLRTTASSDELAQLSGAGVIDGDGENKVARLEEMERFLTSRNERTTEDFRATRSKWAEEMSRSLETGFGPDMGLTVDVLKTALLAGHIAVGTMEAADGTSKVIFETGESMVAKLALEKLQSVMAAREVVAGNLESSILTNDGKLLEQARAMKGADQVAARALLRAARTQTAMERASGGVSGLGQAVVTETLDELSGGVSRNETIRSLMSDLRDREDNFGVNGEASVSDETKKGVASTLEAIFAKVPDAYLTRETWEASLRATPFKIGEKAASLLDFVNSGFGLDAKSSLVHALVDGSRRRFTEEFLGANVSRDGGEFKVSKNGAGVFTRMLQTAEQVAQRKNKLITEGGGAVSAENASGLSNAVLLAEAQTGFVKMEAKQMETRASLDKYWTLLAGSLVAAGAAMVVGQSADYLKVMGAQLSGSLEAQVSGWGVHIEQVKSALSLLNEQGTINAPGTQTELIKQWAQSSGTGDLVWAERFQMAWSGAKNASDLGVMASAGVQRTMSTMTNIMMFAAAALPFKQAIVGLFNKKTAFLAPNPVS